MYYPVFPVFPVFPVYSRYSRYSLYSRVFPCIPWCSLYSRVFPCIPGVPRSRLQPAFAGFSSKSNKETPKVQRHGVFPGTGNTGIREYPGIPGIHGNQGTRNMHPSDAKGVERGPYYLRSCQNRPNQVVLDSRIPMIPASQLCWLAGITEYGLSNTTRAVQERTDSGGQE